MISPSLLSIDYRHGVGDIDISVDHPHGKPFCLSSIHGHFTGTSGAADLKLNRESWHNPGFNALLYTLRNIGPPAAGFDLMINLADEELRFWYFSQNPVDQVLDKLRLQWVDPDVSKLTKWGLEIATITWEDIDAVYRRTR